MLLSPSVLEELAPDFISQWHGTNDEAAAHLFWQLLDKLPKQVLQQSADKIYALPRVLEAERVLQKLSGTEDMAVEEHGDGRVAFVLTLRCTDDGGVEQSVWLGECVSKDPSLQDFTTRRFAEDPSRADQQEALMSALKDKFTDVHPDWRLVEETPLVAVEDVFHFRAKVQPVERVHKELPQIDRQTSAEAPRDDIYPNQWYVALELAERIRRIYGKEWYVLTSPSTFR